MTRSESEKWRNLPQLLHDAQLKNVHWDTSSGTIRLAIDCLRREPDGRSLSDSPVELTLSEISAVAIGHQPEANGVHPSQYVLPRWVGASDLLRWEFPPAEVDVSINSPQAEEDLLVSHRVEWVLGREADLEPSELRLVVSLGHSPLLGLPTNQLLFLFAGRNLAAASGGTKLDGDAWQVQFESWWRGWEEHWEHERHGSDETESAEPALEDAFIPVGESPEPVPTYRPPAEPPFHLEPTDAPKEVLEPVRAWFEAFHDRDWRRRAESCEHLDVSAQELAQREEEDYEACFGQWGYARQVDDWWIAGSIGEISVRGVEHTMADEDDPAENTESVWTFRIRRRGDRWVIRRWSQGWPAHGSAGKRPNREKPWVNRWSSGDIVS